MDSMAIAADVGRVHLPLLQSERAGAARPDLDRLVGRDRIAAGGISAAIEVGFVGIIKKRNRDPRLIVWHEHVIHFVKTAAG